MNIEIFEGTPQEVQVAYRSWLRSMKGKSVAFPCILQSESMEIEDTTTTKVHLTLTVFWMTVNNLAIAK